MVGSMTDHHVQSKAQTGEPSPHFQKWALHPDRATSMAVGIILCLHITPPHPTHPLRACMFMLMSLCGAIAAAAACVCLQEAEDMLAGVGEMGMETLDAALKKFGVVAPDTKNPISTPFPFNLMFKTSIGPKGDLVGYLRPETAQVGRGKRKPHSLLKLEGRTCCDSLCEVLA